MFYDIKNRKNRIFFFHEEFVPHTVDLTINEKAINRNSYSF